MHNYAIQPISSSPLVENCALIRSGGKKGIKGKADLEGDTPTFLYLLRPYHLNTEGLQMRRRVLPRNAKLLLHPKNPQRRRINPRPRSPRAA
jgi:hypothetical protein